MKYKILLMAVLAIAIQLSSCKKDDEPEDKLPDVPVVEKAKNTDELKTFLTGNNEEEGKTWDGKSYYRRVYNQSEQAFGEEEDMSNDPDGKITDNWILFKYDSYNSDRLGYKVGSLRWKDPMGVTNMNWQMKEGVLDILFLNQNEEYPPAGGKQEWEIGTLNSNTFEMIRERKSGSSTFRERYVWKKRN